MSAKQDRRSDDPFPLRFEEFFERTGGFLAILGADGSVERVNRAALEHSGDLPEDPRGQLLWDTFWFRSLPHMRERLQTRIAEAVGGRSPRTEIEYRIADGSARWADAFFHPLQDAEGRISRVLVEGYDVTLRVLAAEAIRRGDQELRAILDTMSAFIAVCGPDARILRANRPAFEATGLAEEEVVGRFPWELSVLRTMPGDAEKIRAAAEAACRGRASKIEARFTGGDGAVVSVDATYTPLFDEAGRVFRVVMDGRDVSERVAATARLRQSEARYRALFEQSRDGVFVCTVHGTLIEVNAVAAAMFGHDRHEVVGGSLAELLGDPPFVERILADARAGRYARNRELVRGTGTPGERTLELTLGPVRSEESGTPLLQGLVRDLTEQRRLERGLNQSQRLEGLGRVAAGVAHEINNPLTWVLVNVDEAMAVLESSGETASGNDRGIGRLLHEAAEGARRIARIVSELRLLGAPDPGGGADVDVDVDLAVHQAFELARGRIYDRARVVIESRGSSCVRMPEGRLLQVLLNLILNAASAIEPGRPQENEIRATTTSADGTLCVEIADTGCGIPPENLDLIFEPFFTRRDSGEGSGLGLWICERIVSAARGRIEVVSQPGSGTRFHVFLPLARPPVASPPPEPGTRGLEDAKAKRDSPHVDGRRLPRILVIDDEPLIRKLIARVLDGAHAVEIVGSAREALAAVEGDRDFDLLLCDLMMPGTDGVAFQRRLAKIRPSLVERVAFMSGGACNDDARKFLEEQPLPWLAKPFDAGRLRRFVQALLERLAPEPRSPDGSAQDAGLS